MADLRNLKEDPWVYMEERNPSLRNSRGGGGGGGGGENSVIHCYKKQVFLSRKGGLEVWSRVMKEREEDENENRPRVCEEEWAASGYRRNFVDKVGEHSERGSIRRMEGGGDRLFVSRQGVEGVEVWESSHLSAANSLL